MVVPDTPHGTHPVVPRRAGQLIRTPHLGMARHHMPSPGEMHRPDRRHRPLTLGFALGHPQGVPCRGRRGTVPAQWAAWSWHRVLTASHHPVRPCWWLPGCGRMRWLVVRWRPGFGLVRFDWGVVAVRRCCTYPVWWCRGDVIHRWGLAGAGRITPIFFGQCGDLAVSRAYTYQTPHSCVGHDP